jgi:hypothetical protein
VDPTLSLRFVASPARIVELTISPLGASRPPVFAASRLFHRELIDPQYCTSVPSAHSATVPYFVTDDAARVTEDGVKRSILTAVTLTALAGTFVVPAHASMPTGGPTGAKCRYTAVSNPAPDAPTDQMTAVISAGPLVWDRKFSVHCTVQVNSNFHNGNDAAVVWADAVGSGSAWVGIMPPTQRNYTSHENDQDSLCTSVKYDENGVTVTIYWVPGNDGPDGIPGTPDDVAGYWTKDAGRSCGEATQFSTGPAERLIDTVVCPVLASLHTTLGFTGSPTSSDLIWIDSEGDVFVTDGGAGIREDNWQNTLFWDCPLYTNNNGVNEDYNANQKVID